MIDGPSAIPLTGSARSAKVLPIHGDAATGPDAAMIASRIYEWRRKRDTLFGGYPKIFSEPAWDLLLDLFVMQSYGRHVSVTDGCIGSATPLTTAIRHLGKLEKASLVTRERDDADGRRSWLRLTDEGDRLLRQLFLSIAKDIGE